MQFDLIRYGPKDARFFIPTYDTFTLNFKHELIQSLRYVNSEHLETRHNKGGDCAAKR